MSRMKGKIAIITGGASGIGAALARALAKGGADVVIADRQLELAESVAAELVQHGGKATPLALDVRDLDSMKRVVDETIARTGRIDLFFNNAGIGVGGEMDTYSPADWDDVIDVNLRGVAHGVQAVYPRMVAQRSGHIINTASMAGLVTTVGEGSYTATKHAVVGLSKCLRLEAARHGVRVSVLCPGVIRTPIFTGGRFGRLNFGISDEQVLAIWERVRPMDPNVFAERALRAVFANQAIIVLPSWWKALWYLERISPSASSRLWAFLFNKLRRELERLRTNA